MERSAGMRALTLAALFLASTNPMTTTTTNAPGCALYISLGDSISIDSYPAADADRRPPGKASTAALGASEVRRIWLEALGR